MFILIVYFAVAFLLLCIEITYFRIADRFNIIDKPNHRSSHNRITIRGGGMIFPVAVLLWLVYSGFTFPFFVSGLFAIALISFIDDVSTLKSGIRSIIHFMAVSLALYQLNLDLDWYLSAFILIAVVGTINAYNFMDGINGITGGYSLVSLITFIYVNHFIQDFTSESLLIFSLLAVLVFNYFNFRKVAKCFAGDVGSVSIAFLICFLLIQLIAATGNLLCVVFLLIYGLDAVTTIVFRLIRKENITEAHRSHFYQFLANERKWPHLRVASLYALLQLGINGLVILFGSDAAEDMNVWALSLVILISGVGFVALRFVVEGRERLTGRAAVA